MPFSDHRTPPPAWAAESGPEPEGSPKEDATVISLRTRRRVAGAGPSTGSAPVVQRPPDNESHPRTRGVEPDPVDWAREIVLRMLTTSPKSRAQLAKGLHRRDCPAEVAEAVLDRLEEVGLVDDAQFAHDFVRQQQATKGLSGRALAQRLRAKGVDADTTRAAVEGLDPVLEAEQARLLVDKKLRSLHGLERQVQTRRLAGLLARKGYGSELSMRLIREALDAAPEHARD